MGWPGWWMDTRTCRPNCQTLQPPAFVSGLERGWGLSQHLTTWRLLPAHGAPRWPLGLLTRESTFLTLPCSPVIVLFCCILTLLLGGVA